jgi:hypothetical protein
MRLPAFKAALLIGALVVAATPAAADFIDVNNSFFDNTNPGPDFYTLDWSFTLPAGFSNASLNIATFYIDDRGVLQLNGVTVASTGIFGPGNGFMVLSLGGANNPYTFQYGNVGPFAAITSPFVEGLNTLQIVVNDTGNGINGAPGDCTLGCFPTGVEFIATVSYDVAAVPLGPSLPLSAIGVGALGLLAWRRKRKSIAAASA